MFCITQEITFRSLLWRYHKWTINALEINLSVLRSTVSSRIGDISHIFINLFYFQFSSVNGGEANIWLIIIKMFLQTLNVNISFIRKIELQCKRFIWKTCIFNILPLEAQFFVCILWTMHYNIIHKWKPIIPYWNVNDSFKPEYSLFRNVFDYFCQFIKPHWTRLQLFAYWTVQYNIVFAMDIVLNFEGFIPASWKVIVTACRLCSIRKC